MTQYFVNKKNIKIRSIKFVTPKKIDLHLVWSSNSKCPNYVTQKKVMTKKVGLFFPVKIKKSEVAFRLKALK